MLAFQVVAINLWARARHNLAQADLRSERGQTYSEFLWVALGCAVVIAIATVLYAKFHQSACDVPTGTASIPGTPTSPGACP